jgi:D-glycero-D-manno-heptose 1,7-bisphosphate phosphatase
MVKNQKAVFLDRDGVINRALVVEGVPHPPNSLDEVEILPGVIQAVKVLKKYQYTIVVVTNQPDIANGKSTVESVNRINEYLKKKTGIQDFYVCPHNDLSKCNCRKPKPGMLLAAANRLGIDLKKSFLVGDRWRDIEAGQNAGCRNFYINYKYNEKSPNPPFIEVSSVLEATRLIVKGGENA